ncbi:HSP90 family protein [Paenibacillus sp. UKAQ_18]|nr:HSP90 family protein [Paenibacillus sp. UKAQ_18]
MSQTDEYRFQVNLGGMIDILANHLYSSPRVFIREVLQNATDAITARKELRKVAAESNVLQEDKALEDTASESNDYEGKVIVELSGSGEHQVLMIQDNGIGLSEEDIHRFLSIIGQSSKKGADLLASETSFIGRFGIGLLSCFMVSDEIVVLTRSVKEGISMEWRGKPDGTYTIRRLETELPVGTQIYLRCKPGSEFYYEPANVEESLFYYGALLPYPVMLSVDGETKRVNLPSTSWMQDPEQLRSRRSEVLDLGYRLMGERFSDFIPLRTASGRTGGIAFILPRSVNLNSKRLHRVYLKHMLVSDKAENVLPEWAFFIKSLIWTDELQPTASREYFYENEQLDDVRSELGTCIREELLRMAQYEPDRLQHWIRLHELSMKALAVEDDEFLRIMYRWFSFESTFGRRELKELIREADGLPLHYTSTVDEYRQITHVAAAQSMLVINGGYIYDSDILERLHWIDPNLQTERLSPEEVSLSFTGLTQEERESYYGVLRVMDAALQPMRCRAELKRFEPASLPVLYTISQDALTLRSMENTVEETTSLFSNVLDSLKAGVQQNSGYSTLYFNLNNPVVARILEATDTQMVTAATEMMYVNALMMGHYPMNRSELGLMNRSVLHFINWGLGNGQNA